MFPLMRPFLPYREVEHANLPIVSALCIPPFSLFVHFGAERLRYIFCNGMVESHFFAASRGVRPSTLTHRSISVTASTLSLMLLRRLSVWGDSLLFSVSCPSRNSGFALAVDAFRFFEHANLVGRKQCFLLCCALA